MIVSMLPLDGFRERTLAKLQYPDVKTDLEADILPLHIHVEATIARGEYGDFDTFLNSEAVRYLKIYVEVRKGGTNQLPPEDITETSQ